MTTTAKRRRLQFGLRGLLVAVTVVAVSIGSVLAGIRWLDAQILEAYRKDAEHWAKVRAAKTLQTPPADRSMGSH